MTVSSRAPAGARPGDHPAVVLLTTQPRRASGVAIRMRVGVVVFVHVAGTIVRRLDVRSLRVRRRRARSRRREPRQRRRASARAGRARAPRPRAAPRRHGRADAAPAHASCAASSASDRRPRVGGRTRRGRLRSEDVPDPSVTSASRRRRRLASRRWASPLATRSSSWRFSARARACSRWRRCSVSRTRSCSWWADSSSASCPESRTSRCDRTSSSSRSCRRFSTHPPSSRRFGICDATPVRSHCSRSGSYSRRRLPSQRSVTQRSTGLSWPVCFVLGALVAPTDAVAANAIASRLGVPRRIATLIEGESLVNDATALVAYRFAVAAVLTGSFSLWHATWRFAVDVVGGIAIGLAVGFVIRMIRRRLNHSPTEIAIALLSGYFAYLPAQAAGVSAVLAAVTVEHLRRLVHAGADHRRDPVAGRRRVEHPHVPAERAALRAGRAAAAPDPRFAVRNLHVVAHRLMRRSSARRSSAFASSGSTPPPTCPRLLSRRIRERDPYPPWQYSVLMGWTGLRGAVTLAAALALPLTTGRGRTVPGAEPADLPRLLRHPRDARRPGADAAAADPAAAARGRRQRGQGGVKGRIHAAEAALARLEELVAEDWVRDDTAERLRGPVPLPPGSGSRRGSTPRTTASIEERSQDFQRLRRELLDAERRAVVELRRQGKINDDVMNRVQRDLDLEDARLDV